MQRIVWATSVQSMNGGGVVQKNYGQFPLLKVSILEAIHAIPRIKTSTVVKKGNGTQRKTKVSP